MQPTGTEELRNILRSEQYFRHLKPPNYPALQQNVHFIFRSNLSFHKGDYLLHPLKDRHSAITGMKIPSELLQY